MLTSIELTGFRSFESYRLNDLARVNLLVGRNNCGKTTILEALEILTQGGDPRVLAGCINRRGESVSTEGDDSDRYLDISHLFYRHSCDAGARLKIVGAEPQRTAFVTCSTLLSADLPIEALGSRQLDLFDASDDREKELVLQIETSSFPKPIHLPLTGFGGLSFRRWMRPPWERFVEETKPVFFLTTDRLDSWSLSQLWDAVALTPEEEQVTSALRIIDSDLERIAFLSSEDSRRPRRSGNVFVKLSGTESRVPLGSMGDGMQRLLNLSLALIRSRSGVALIDEIDTGFHYSIMTKMWRMVVETAERLKVQVFATTHSQDCVRGLARLHEEHPDLAEMVRVHRVEQGEPSSMMYTPEEIEIAAEQNVDVR